MNIVLELSNQTEGVVRERVLESFRPEIIGFKELLDDYVSHCLKTVHISVNNITYMDSIQEAISLGYIPEYKLQFYRYLNKIGNKTTHVYKKPKIEDLLKFYINNKNNYNETLEYIKNKLNNQVSDANCTRLDINGN